MPKPILQWKEPKDFDRMVRAGTPKWMAIAGRGFLFVLPVGLGLLLWIGLRSKPNSHSPPLGQIIWVLMAFGFFTALILPWLVSLFSREVRFFDHAIGRSSVSGSSPGRLWKYGDISGWAIAEKPFGGTTVRVLWLVLRKGGIVAMGIADHITREQIANLFDSKAVPEMRDDRHSILLSAFRSF